MPEPIDVPLVDLLVDVRNARLRDEQPSQQATLLALARQQGNRLLKLASDVVEHGLDPISLPGVIRSSDQKKRYVVIEGNRRIVALKALETPSTVAPALDPTQQKRLTRLAARFAENPITRVRCVLFDSEEELDHWVTLRHTGPHEGVGLVEWGADEKDRYAARHGNRSPAGQVLDFAERIGVLDTSAPAPKRIITSLTRLLTTRLLRDRLGITLSQGQLYSQFPAQETAKGLARVIEDLSTERIKVRDIYNKDQREDYAKSLTTTDLPDPATRLSAPVLLHDLDTSGAQRPKKPKKSRATPPPPPRAALIPASCALHIKATRINHIYTELLTLEVERFPNACSVTLRVFVELSVDHYIEQHKLMTEQERRSSPLAKRLKAVAADMQKNGTISPQLETAIQKVADTQFVLAASTVSFNQYVHNQYVFPKATELRLAWDELQPFMEKLWP
jgi:hypothetical protein